MKIKKISTMDISENFGSSLHLDLYKCNAALSKEEIRRFIHQFIEKADMKIHGDLHLDYYVGKNDQTVGWTGICMLTTSSFSIHTATNTGRVYIELFSCSDIPVRSLVQFTKEFFNTVSCSYILTER
jgi:S-adenosylmethionine/arginine decarboxylase-like enzyme